MLVGDLRKVIEKYNKDEKDRIIIELYKRIPKRVKEDYDIDNYIMNINKKITKENKELSIIELEKEIKHFLQCVDGDLYAILNRIVSKLERSKWRFKVKKYYKDLNSFDPLTDSGRKATELLIKLFKILSLGTHILKFSNWETFRAIQISQSDFYETILKRKLVNGFTKENLLDCIDLLKVEYDPYEFHSSMLYTFESCLKTPDSKYLAIELLNNEVITYKEKFKELKNEKKDYFYVKEYNNYFVECIIDIYFNLCEVDNGINYFHKNYISDFKEVKEYILLKLLDRFELYHEWILEYEKHIGKIDYRDSLKDRYKKLKEGKI